MSTTPASPPPPILAGLREGLALRDGEHLYALVDGARNIELAFLAKAQAAPDSAPTSDSLFEGEMARALADVAPYLVRLDPAGPFLDSWTRNAGTNAGILLLGPASLPELRAHLRQVFIVQDESGQEFFFRFYDPRVLRPYLPTCTPAELASFFGPMRAVVADAPTPGDYVCLSRRDGELTHRHFRLPPSAASPPRSAA